MYFCILESLRKPYYKYISKVKTKTKKLRFRTLTRVAPASMSQRRVQLQTAKNQEYLFISAAKSPEPGALFPRSIPAFPSCAELLTFLTSNYPPMKPPRMNQQQQHRSALRSRFGGILIRSSVERWSRFWRRTKQHSGRRMAQPPMGSIMR